MRQNSAALSKVLLVKMMHNFLVEDESWGSEISVAFLLKFLFLSCGKNKNTLNEPEQTCERIVEKVCELLLVKR